jgi:hypothetical protein
LIRMSSRTLCRALAAAALAGGLLAGSGSALAAEPGVTPMGAHPAEVSTIGSALTNAPSEAKWVRIFFDWSQLQPSDGPIDPYNQLGDFDARINQFRAKGIKVTAVVTQAPGWVDVNSAQGAVKYAELMTKLAQHFTGRVATWEVWNEPDGNVHWPGGPKPAEYTRLLRAAYAAAKAADPTALVITGGMVGNDFDFLSELYNNGAQNFFDGVGVHTDTACLLRDPSFYYREPTGRVGRYSFTGYREVYRTMREHGDGAKQIWMTEFGWAESVGDSFKVMCADGADAGKKAAGVTRAEQADFLKQAFACMAPDPFVKMASWFTLIDPSSFRTTPMGYGLIDSDNKVRPALAAMQSVGDGRGAGSKLACGGKVDVDPPTATINVPDVYYNRLVVRGTATDPTTPVSKIELWVDGKRVEGVNQDGGKYENDWFGSTKLSLGDHTIELRAYDEAQNVGSVKKVVKHGDPATAPRIYTPRATFSAKKKGKKIIVRARVLRALSGDYTEAPHGGLRLVFQWKRKHKFVQMYRTQKGVSRPIRYTFKTTRPGRWRVRPQLVIDGPYKNIKLKSSTFRVR